MFDYYVVCHGSRIPDPKALLTELQTSMLEVAFEQAFDPRETKERFIMCRFEGLVSGFDYDVNPYDHDTFELTKQESNLIGDRDTQIHLCTYSNAQEIAGASCVVTALAKITDGILIADLADDLIQGEAVLTWLHDSMPNVREQFNGPSQMRGHNMKDVPRVSITINTKK